MAVVALASCSASLGLLLRAWGTVFLLDGLGTRREGLEATLEGCAALLAGQSGCLSFWGLVSCVHGSPGHVVVGQNLLVLVQSSLVCDLT